MVTATPCRMPSASPAGAPYIVRPGSWNRGSSAISAKPPNSHIRESTGCPLGRKNRLKYRSFRILKLSATSMRHHTTEAGQLFAQRARTPSMTFGPAQIQNVINIHNVSHADLCASFVVVGRRVVPHPLLRAVPTRKAESPHLPVPRVPPPRRASPGASGATRRGTTPSVATGATRPTSWRRCCATRCSSRAAGRRSPRCGRSTGCCP